MIIHDFTHITTILKQMRTAILTINIHYSYNLQHLATSKKSKSKSKIRQNQEQAGYVKKKVHRLQKKLDDISQFLTYDNPKTNLNQSTTESRTDRFMFTAKAYTLHQ